MKRGDLDIVRDILARVINATARGEGSFTEAMAIEIERQIRKDWGGCDVYVPKCGDRAERRDALQKDLARGVPVKQAASAHGVSRASIYKILNELHK